MRTERIQVFVVLNVMNTQRCCDGNPRMALCVTMTLFATHQKRQFGAFLPITGLLERMVAMTHNWLSAGRFCSPGTGRGSRNVVGVEFGRNDFHGIPGADMARMVSYLCALPAFVFDGPTQPFAATIQRLIAEITAASWRTLGRMATSDSVRTQGLARGR